MREQEGTGGDEGFTTNMFSISTRDIHCWSSVPGNQRRPPHPSARLLKTHILPQGHLRFGQEPGICLAATPVLSAMSGMGFVLSPRDARAACNWCSLPCDSGG